MTYYDYINVDLTTGRRLAFTDLFDTEAEIARAAQVINEKIAQEPEWYFIDQFTPGLIAADQGFLPHRIASSDLFWPLRVGAVRGRHSGIPGFSPVRDQLHHIAMLDGRCEA